MDSLRNYYSVSFNAESAIQKLAKAKNPLQNTAIGKLMEAQEKTQRMFSSVSKVNLFNHDFKLNAFWQIQESQLALQQAAGNYQKAEKALWSFADLSKLWDGLSHKELLIYTDLPEDDVESPEPESIIQYEPGALISLNDINRTQSLIRSIYKDNEQMFRIDPRHFEEMIAELLRKKNLNVELTKQTRDGGKDIIALHDLNGLGQNKYLIECKRNAKNRPVGVDVLRSFSYVVQDEGANKGIIFTSSYFTTDAISMKDKHPYMSDLKDGADIIKWIKEYSEKQSKIATLDGLV